MIRQVLMENLTIAAWREAGWWIANGAPQWDVGTFSMYQVLDYTWDFRTFSYWRRSRWAAAILFPRSRRQGDANRRERVLKGDAQVCTQAARKAFC